MKIRFHFIVVIEFLKKAIASMQAVLILFLLVAVSVAQQWVDTDTTSSIWSACSRRDIRTLKSIIEREPSAAFARSADGRGALFWAYEFGHTEAIEWLESLGVDPLETDVNGATPKQLGIDNEEINKHRQFPSYDTPVDDEDEEEDSEADEDGDL